MLSSVDFPEPDGPSRTTNSPANEVEVDAAQRLHRHLAHFVDLPQVTGHEDRGYGGSGGHGVVGVYAIRMILINQTFSEMPANLPVLAKAMQTSFRGL